MLALFLFTQGGPALGDYVYKQPDPSICDVALPFENGFLCAIQPSRVDLDPATRDTQFDDRHNSLGDRYYGYGYHVVVFPTPGTPVKGVYVHFKGSYGRPYSQDTGRFPDKTFLEESARSGYIMIEPAYNNRYAINDDECRSNNNNKDLDNCAGRVREDKITGLALSPSDLIGTTIEDTPVADSIEHRLKVLTTYLQRQGFRFPVKFIDGDKVLWSKLRVGGHSQGSGIAAYLAKKFGVEHACILAGIHDTNDNADNPPRNLSADWLLKPGSQTPVQNQKAVLCKEDPAVEGFVWGLSLLGLQEGTNYSVTSFSGGYFDEEGKSVDSHSAVVLDPRYKNLRNAACFSTPVERTVTYTPELNLGNPSRQDCFHMLVNGTSYPLGCQGAGARTATKTFNIQASETGCNVVRLVNYSDRVLTRDTARGGKEMKYYALKKNRNSLDVIMNDNDDTTNQRKRASFNDIHFRLDFPSSNYTIQNSGLPCQ